MRDDIFSPVTSGHVLKLLLLPVSLQRISGEEETREGEGALSHILGCLDVKDAFLQVPQEKPLKVVLGGEEFLVKRHLLDRRLGQKRGLTFSQSISQRSSTRSSMLSVHA